jgi:hypothetical protein
MENKKTITIFIIIALIFMTGCSTQKSVVITQTYTFSEGIKEINEIDAKYNVQDLNILQENIDAILLDYNKLKSKVQSVGQTDDTRALSLLIDFKINLFKSTKEMYQSSFEVGDDICTKLDEFETSYNHMLNTIRYGREAISSIDKFMTDYPAYSSKINKDSMLNMREELESNMNLLDANSKNLKEYVDSKCA